MNAVRHAPGAWAAADRWYPLAEGNQQQDLSGMTVSFK